jgi:hypothetical protein
MRRIMGLIAAGGLAGGLLAACGDDRPSQETLTKRVTAICQASGERHEQAMEGFDFADFDPDTSDLTGIVSLIEQNVAIGVETATELDKVRGPKAAEEEIDRWIDVNAQIAANAEDMVAAAERGDREEFKALGAVEEELHAEFPEAPAFEGC